LKQQVWVAGGMGEGIPHGNPNAHGEMLSGFMSGMINAFVKDGLSKNFAEIQR
jgi:hypothetical protein